MRLTDTAEANFDGLVGPTHNYAGLSYGNVASAAHAAKPSNPREAALQGLRKMRALADMGMPQGVLPPQERPHLGLLRQLGFSGRDADVLQKAQRDAPHLLAAACSASAMWTANAATICPSADAADGKVHLTPANLASNLHRSLEPASTARALAATFSGPQFVHHAPLPTQTSLGDEGAANHTRFCHDYGSAGVQLFVYGEGQKEEAKPSRFPARQTRAASEAIARLHGLGPQRAVFALQNPQAIDAGVFHHDVIGVGNRELMLCHEAAFADAGVVDRALRQALPGLVWVTVAASKVSVQDAIQSYLFNSQLICVPNTTGHTLVVAQECQEHPKVWGEIQRLIADPAVPIHAVKVFDLRQSMHNGGGPACLRLRVVLTPAEAQAVNPGSWITSQHASTLEDWVRAHYRDHLTQQDLSDPALLVETHTALDRLTQILGVGSIYDFQR